MFSVSLPAPEHRTADDKAESDLTIHGLQTSAPLTVNGAHCALLDCKPKKFMRIANGLVR
jgi:hypothetical protein